MIIDHDTCHGCHAQITFQRPSGKVTSLKLCSDLNKLMVGVEFHVRHFTPAHLTAHVGFRLGPLLLSVFHDL